MNTIRILFFLALLIPTTSQAQRQFEKLWSKVETFEKEGKIKSANEVVDVIYQKALRKKNEIQLVKALLYQSKYIKVLEEDALLTIVQRLSKHNNQTKFPVNCILETFLADVKWKYLKTNRWKIYRRTNLEEADSVDFRTWDIKKLSNSIRENYNNVLSKSDQLQAIPIEDYDYLLIQGDEKIRHLRPTLLDVLAHRMMPFLEHTESGITQPKEQFDIENPLYYELPESFIKLTIEWEHEEDANYNVLRLYQKLERFHFNNNNLSALVELFLDRTEYLKNQSVDWDRVQYIKALERMYKSLPDGPWKGLAQIKYAVALYDRTSKTKFREDRERALHIAKEVMVKYRNTDAAQLATTVIDNIKNERLSVQTEKYYPSSGNIMAHVAYINIQKLYVHFYKVPLYQSFERSYNYKERDSVIKQYFATHKAIRTHEVKLLQRNQYFFESTDIALPKLDKGHYLMLTTTKPKFNKEELFTWSDIKITDLVCVTSDTKNGDIYQVLHRNTGKPIENAKISFGSQTKYTDKIGETNFSNIKRNSPILVTYKKDSLYLGESFTRGYNSPGAEWRKKKQCKSFLFTDRNLYRPGQTVYFKGIVLTRHNHETQPETQQNFLVVIRDSNWKEIKSIAVKTNEFGSFSGKIKIPLGRLTGQYRMKVEQVKTNYDQFDNGNTRFSVEAYKRPKFEVKLDEFSKKYKVNDSIQVTGQAKAFFGGAIANAKLKYSIIRTSKKTHWKYREYDNNSSKYVIAKGVLSTDNLGKFSIPFKAIPDLTKKKEHLPVFNYKIEVEVTDTNGETRSDVKTIHIGYHDATLNLKVPQKWKADVPSKVEIHTQNLNGIQIDKKVNVKIYKLISPDRILRERRLVRSSLWPSEEQWRTLFPNDPYKEETNVKNWKKGGLVFETQINTANKQHLELVPKSNLTQKVWNSGKYIVEANMVTATKLDITERYYFSLTNDEDQYLADNQLFESVIVNDKIIEQDGFIHIRLLTAATNLEVTMDASYNETFFYKEHLMINGRKDIKLPLNLFKKIEGLNVADNIKIRYSMMRNNDFTFEDDLILFNKKEELLKVETVTFRDKLRPGKKEKWRFTIKNQKNIKFHAEVLASMFDLSLDQLSYYSHQWKHSINIPDKYYNLIGSKHVRGFNLGTHKQYNRNWELDLSMSRKYDQLNDFGLLSNSVARLLRGRASGIVVEDVEEEADIAYEQYQGLDRGYSDFNYRDGDKASAMSYEYMSTADSLGKTIKQKPKQGLTQIKARTNLQETAFFYPHLRTNKNGDVSFEFETPEALTRWKLQLLAHTKNGVSGYLNKEVVTQKELMVIPNAPRFLRENDTIVFQSKISNLSNKSLSGTASLLLYDALTGDDITNKLLRNKTTLTAFEIDQKGNTTASWKLAIPEGMQAVEYKVVAQAGNYSDGESNVLPVLSNRMLVTERMPITVSAGETETYKLKPLLENTSKTLRHHQFTLEYTTNPTWYAIQSLPYLMEFPHECAEQTFSRYYANTLGSYIVNSNPKIKEVFETWKANDQLVSKLELNEQLKQVLIAETPWVRDAQNSAEQQKRLALLFDLEKMAEQETAVLEKLKKLQFPNGAFPWFAGGRENYWITQHIVAGFGHLNKLKANQYKSNYETLLTKAIAYLDSEFILRHKKKLKYRKVITELSYWELNYLYTRSFFVKTHPLSKELGEITALYLAHTSKDWLARSIRNKIILAMVCHRYGKKSEAKRILTNLKELAIVDKDKGMYWKANRSGWRWNEAPIETQALAIEAFVEITKDTKTVEALKIWLLNSKRKTEWETTKATTEAIYALLLQGNNWLTSEKGATITVGSETIKTAEIETVQAGSGYFKKEWKGEAVTSNMGNVVVKNESKVPQYGGLYWQYFEDLEAIKNGNQKGEIQIEKELYLKKNTDAGPQLQKITATTPIAVGDLVTMRIVLHVKEDFEFVHLKDMRASGFEPVDVLSRYHWKDGLGYYQSTKDVATHFFFDYLRKGTYVLEYDVRANNAGQFSNGISTIQSMYAPEFGSHTQGVKVLIAPQR